MNVRRLPAALAAVALAVTGLVALAGPAAATPPAVPTPDLVTVWDTTSGSGGIGASSTITGPVTISAALVPSAGGLVATLAAVSSDTPQAVTLTDTDPRVGPGTVVATADLATDVTSSSSYVGSLHTYRLTAPATVTAGATYWLNVTINPGYFVGFVTTGSTPLLFNGGGGLWHNTMMFQTAQIAGRLTVATDTTAPLAAADYSPASPDGTHGWYRTLPTATFTCVDYTGVAACPAPQTATGDGPFTPTGTATDTLGNTSTVTGQTVKVDTTAPTGIATFDGTPGAHGWYTSTGTATWACSDVTSGVDVCPAATAISTDGTTDLAGTITDLAGNTGAAPLSVKLDATAPTGVATFDGTKGANGWYVSTGTATWACLDATSGVATCPTDVPVTSEGTTSLDGAIADNAGNTGAAPLDVHLDTVAPALVPTVTPAKVVNGLRQGPISVTWACQDATSGVATCPETSTVTGEGTDTTITAQATDSAGNISEVTVSGLAADNAGPVVVGTVIDAAFHGWYSSDVHVDWSCVDSGAGITACPAPSVLTGEGRDQSATVTVADDLGNTTTATVAGINIDRTAPKVTLTGVRPFGRYVLGTSKIGCAVTDALSGPGKCVVAYSEKPHRTGVYLVVAVGTDVAGNVTTSTVTAYTLVPKVTIGWTKGTVLRTGHHYTMSLTMTDARGHRIDAPTGYLVPVRTTKAGKVATTFTTRMTALSPMWRDGVGRYHVRVTPERRMALARAWKFRIQVADIVYARAYQVR